MYYQKVGDVYDAAVDQSNQTSHQVVLISRQELKNIVLLVQKVNRLVFHLSTGNGAISSTVITVDLDSNLTDLSIDTPVRISGIAHQDIMVSSLYQKSYLTHSLWCRWCCTKQSTTYTDKCKREH